MRKRLLCPILPQPSQRVLLPEVEANHAQRVLRLRSGDEVEALDGRGHRILGRLRMSDLGVQLEYVDALPTQSTLEGGAEVVPVDLEMAILKGESMEWVVEKATELGIRRLVPVVADHTVIQIKSKGPAFFRERWQKIADQALKQCGRVDGLRVEAPTTLEALLENRSSVPQIVRVWCDEENAQRSSLGLAQWVAGDSFKLIKEVKILIGPEGGWSQAERTRLNTLAAQVEGNVLSVSLGPLVLRAETAALVSMSLISAFMRAGR